MEEDYSVMQAFFDDTSQRYRVHNIDIEFEALPKHNSPLLVSRNHSPYNYTDYLPTWPTDSCIFTDTETRVNDNDLIYQLNETEQQLYTYPISYSMERMISAASDINLALIQRLSRATFLDDAEPEARPADVFKLIETDAAPVLADPLNELVFKYCSQTNTAVRTSENTLLNYLNYLNEICPVCMRYCCQIHEYDEKEMLRECSFYPFRDNFDATCSFPTPLYLPEMLDDEAYYSQSGIEINDARAAKYHYKRLALWLSRRKVDIVGFNEFSDMYGDEADRLPKCYFGDRRLDYRSMSLPELEAYLFRISVAPSQLTLSAQQFVPALVRAVDGNIPLVSCIFSVDFDEILLCLKAADALNCMQAYENIIFRDQQLRFPPRYWTDPYLGYIQQDEQSGSAEPSSSAPESVSDDLQQRTNKAETAFSSGLQAAEYGGGRFAKMSTTEEDELESRLLQHMDSQSYQQVDIMFSQSAEPKDFVSSFSRCFGSTSDYSYYSESYTSEEDSQYSQAHLVQQSNDEEANVFVENAIDHTDLDFDFKNAQELACSFPQIALTASSYSSYSSSLESYSTSSIRQVSYYSPQPTRKSEQQAVSGTVYQASQSTRREEHLRVRVAPMAVRPIIARPRPVRKEDDTVSPQMKPQPNSPSPNANIKTTNLPIRPFQQGQATYSMRKNAPSAPQPAYKPPPRWSIQRQQMQQSREPTPYGRPKFFIFRNTYKSIEGLLARHAEAVGARERRRFTKHLELHLQANSQMPCAMFAPFTPFFGLEQAFAHTDMTVTGLQKNPFREVSSAASNSVASAPSSPRSRSIGKPLGIKLLEEASTLSQQWAYGNPAESSEGEESFFSAPGVASAPPALLPVPPLVQLRYDPQPPMFSSAVSHACFMRPCYHPGLLCDPDYCSCAAHDLRCSHACGCFGPTRCRLLWAGCSGAARSDSDGDGGGGSDGDDSELDHLEDNACYKAGRCCSADYCERFREAGAQLRERGVLASILPPTSQLSIRISFPFKMVLFCSKIHGFGVMAASPFRSPVGYPFLEYNGEIVDSTEAEKRGRIGDAYGLTYLFTLRHENYPAPELDAGIRGGIARYINHLDKANAQTRLFSFPGESIVVILFVTKKTSGEVTFNYGSQFKSDVAAVTLKKTVKQ